MQQNQRKNILQGKTQTQFYSNSFDCWQGNVFSVGQSTNFPNVQSPPVILPCFPKTVQNRFSRSDFPTINTINMTAIDVPEKGAMNAALAQLKPRVLIIVTGGTICMTHSGVSSSLRPTPLAERLQSMADFKDSSLPNFDVLEWEDLIDSSDVNLVHWEQLAKDIEKNYHHYEGFVILHGTDTLAYTASALSFMLENLNKPVVLTGSMLPMDHIQTDARKNLAVALMIGAYSQITEVVILFGSRLLRGNRSRKLDCSQMDAFDSPNFPPLGRVGVDVTVDDQILLTPSKWGFRIFCRLCMNIVVVTVTPGFQPSLLKPLFHSPTRPLAVILQLYGTGTAPARGTDFLATIEFGIAQGIEVMCLSQCPSGTCSLLTYENGALLYHLGVIEGKNMTPEAAFTKLAYLMGKGYAGRDLRDLMEKDVRGEVTENPLKVTGQAFLASSMQQSSAMPLNAVLPSIGISSYGSQEIITESSPIEQEPSPCESTLKASLVWKPEGARSEFWKPETQPGIHTNKETHACHHAVPDK